MTEDRQIARISGFRRQRCAGIGLRIEENPNEAGSGKLRHRCRRTSINQKPIFTAAGTRDFFRAEPPDRCGQPNRDDMGAFDVFITEAMNIERVLYRITPGGHYGVQILRQAVRMALLPFPPDAVDIGMHRPEDGIVRGGGVLNMSPNCG